MKKSQLLKTIQSMMTPVNLPISFSGRWELTDAYIVKGVPSKSMLSTPYKLQPGSEPTSTEMR